MIRRRAPFIKMPGDGNKRFGDTELTQAFETGVVTTRATRRQIVNAAAQAAGLPGSGGAAGALCCGDALTGGGTGVGATGGGSGTGTGSTTQQLTAKVSGLKTTMSDVNAVLVNQSQLNSDYTLLLGDLYTQSGFTPPIPIPTDPTGPS